MKMERKGKEIMHATNGVKLGGNFNNKPQKNKKKNKRGSLKRERECVCVLKIH
jgi:hypothetical protein